MKKLMSTLAGWTERSKDAIAKMQDALANDPVYALENSGRVFVAVAEGETAARLVLFLEKSDLALAEEYALHMITAGRESSVSRSTSVLSNVMEDARHNAWVRAFELVHEAGLRERTAAAAKAVVAATEKATKAPAVRQ